ncbi:MAG: DUF1761 domain-containing protein [Xanthobacteraceae bacterium]|nr:DUF1761 domain-containing protein [Xanthobacteraceae bacterium]
MIFYGVNIVAVIVAAVAAWFFGAAYYGPLGKIWLEAQGKTAEEVKRAGKSGVAKAAPFILSFLAEIVMAAMLAGLIIRTGPVTVSHGLKLAFAIWLGFLLTTMAVNYAFADRKPALTLIDAGHWLGVVLIMGAVIGFFGF